MTYFLESKLNIQIATIDQCGYPTIQPLWFLCDKQSGKIYAGTQKMTKKVQNILRNPDKIYFSINDEYYPYRGRREDKHEGTLEQPLAKMIIENTRNGVEIAIEIMPKFFSAWNFGKAM
jgi:uncharacterized pyridoxamine 5'-phosphate oxidase family protein